MSDSTKLKRWVQVHKWSSLICTLFLLLLCLTGLPLIFGDEIEAWSEPRASATSTGPDLPLDELVRRTSEQRPGTFVQFLFWPDEHPELVGLGLAKVPDAPLDAIEQVLVDRRSGEVRSSELLESGVMHTVLELHRNLCAGSFGYILQGLMALLFLASTVSGIVIYGPFMRRLDFGTIRRRSTQLSWLDTHNLIGIVTVVWALVVGATGFMNTLEPQLFDAWQSAQLTSFGAQSANAAAPARTSSLDAVVATARQAVPQMEATGIGFPGTRYGTPGHYLVWTHGTTTLTSRLFTPVLVEAPGARLTRAAPLPWYLRAIEVSRPLHFGDYGGLPLKILWALFDLILIVLLSSGIYLWARKWRGGSPFSEAARIDSRSLAEEATV